MDPVAWLLDPSDPAVRAQALVHLRGFPPGSQEVRQARAESARHGGVARLLEGLAVPDDPRALYVPKYHAPFHKLVALAEMGVPGDEPRVAAVLDACLAAFHKPDGGFGRDEGHLCVTGNLVRTALRLGRGSDPRVQGGLRWLVAQQMRDGGWHCWPDKFPGGALDAWEALGAFAAVPPAERSPEMQRAVHRGVGFVIERAFGLKDGYAPWTRLHFPRHYYYDALVGLELATQLGDPRDPRLAPGLDWLRSKRRPDGRWATDASHPDLEGSDYQAHRADFPDPTPLVVDAPGAPSKWATLKALAVLRRAGEA